MATSDDRRGAARGRAEELLSRPAQREQEQNPNRGKERLALDEKIARLKQLRLAKEAADRAASDGAPRRKGARKAQS
jgi:hypothetical protein